MEHQSKNTLPGAVVESVDAVLRAGAVGEAISMLELEVERSPQARELVDRLINLLLGAGNIERALEIALADHDRHDADDDRASMVVHLALRTGDIARALDIARRLVTSNPDSAQRQSLLALVAMQADSIYEAEGAIRTAIGLEPNSLAHRRFLCSILARLDRNSEQVSALEEAIKVAPDDAGLHRELSVAYATEGRLEDAEGEARKALELAPGSVDMRIHLSGLVSARGNVGEAAELLHEVLRIQPDHAIAHYSLSHHLWKMGEVDLAVVHASRASTLDAKEAGFRDHYLTLLALRANHWAETPKGNAVSQEPDRLFDVTYSRDTAGVQRAVANWARIIAAIMLRDMHTRHAGTRLGFAWAILEPLAHLGVLAAVFSVFNRGQPPVGQNWFFFYATGVIPFLMWSHVTSQGFHGLVGNVTLLQIPAIKRLDVMLANALVELSISIAVGVVMFLVFWAVEAGPAPRDPLAIIQAVSTLWLFSFGLSVINGTIETVNGVWLKIWPSVMRLQYFVSGIFYVPFQMPQEVRDILVLNPLLQCIEWFRAGFFDQYNPPWLDRGYTVLVALGVVLFGLVFETAMRRRGVR